MKYDGVLQALEKDKGPAWAARGSRGCWLLGQGSCQCHEPWRFGRPSRHSARIINHVADLDCRSRSRSLSYTIHSFYSTSVWLPFDKCVNKDAGQKRSTVKRPAS